MTYPHTSVAIPHWTTVVYTFVVFMIGWLVGFWRGSVVMRKCMSGECDNPWCENNPKKN